MNRELQNIDTHCPEGFRDTPIGRLPADWGIARLDEIAIPLTETAGREKYETVSISAGVGFVNQAEKFGKELSGKQYEKYTVLHKGDFSYNKGNSNRYPQGCIYRLNDRETAAVPNVFESFRIVKGCPEYYEQLFISGFLNHQLYKKINHGVRDDGLLNLTSKDFYNCIVPVPPLRQQKYIVNVLSTCDKLIRQYQEKAQCYEDLKKSCLIRMFPTSGGLVPDVRFPGFSNSWEQIQLSDVTEEFKSGTFISAADIDEIGAFPVYGGNGLRGFCSTYNYDGEFALIGRQGALCGNMNYSIGKAYFTEHAVAVKANSSTNTRFLFYLLDKMNLGQYSDQSAQPGLAVGKIKKLKGMFPAKKEQDRIASFFEELDNLLSLYQHHLIEEQKKKKVIMQVLLLGNVRVDS